MRAYDRDGEFVGLLTTNTVARWLAAELATGEGFFIDAPVEEALQYIEDSDKYKFRSRSDTVFDALGDFETYAQDGVELRAILITESGKKTEGLLGIVLNRPGNVAGS